mmetsp:Transcript_39127/g.63991  ORF Transcript_39127/g.63991 Transcript_39127/m.63991 type:complete len:151 (+) Transcript_39127:2-454(+)
MRSSVQMYGDGHPPMQQNLPPPQAISQRMRYHPYHHQNMVSTQHSSHNSGYGDSDQFSQILLPEQAAQQPSMSVFGDAMSVSPFPYVPFSPVNSAIFYDDDSHTMMSAMPPSSFNFLDNESVQFQHVEQSEQMLLDSIPNPSETNNDHTL